MSMFFKPIPQQHPFVTCMGRSVNVRPLDASVERALLEIQTHRDPAQAFSGFLSSTIQAHVKAADGSALEDMTLMEEQDLLIFLRWVSNPLYKWQETCESCRKQGVFSLDLQKLDRFPMRCSDPTCPCHELHEQIEGGRNDLMWSVDAWSSIPENHLKTSPPVLVWEAAMDKDLNHSEHYGDLKVGFRLPRVSDRGKFSSSATSALADQLSATVEWVSGTGEKGMMDTRTMNLSERRIALRKFIHDPHMTQDLRGSLLMFLKALRAGVSTSYPITCPSCAHSKRGNLTLGGDFFLILKQRGVSEEKTGW